MRRLVAAIALAGFLTNAANARDRWTAAQANAWYARQPWLVGANYVPANAVNQLEMWQPATFDPARIDEEFGWAEAAGMNTMRLFLHDLLWQADAAGLTRRIDTVLAIAARHHIRPMLVLFDSCWDPRPQLGPQRPPLPGVHNSGWVQSPHIDALSDAAQRPRLKAYVTGVIRAFAQDDRILAWDVWNEPVSPASTYPGQPKNKAELTGRLLPLVYEWARSADPSQPITSGLAVGPAVTDDDWSPAGRHSAIETTQLGQSDILSFHDYSWPETFERRMTAMLSWGRPVLVTEFLARGSGSTFDAVLPIAHRAKVGVMNWGLVDGREQTRFPWDSWQRPYATVEPVVWHHVALRADGTPYRPAEVALIKRLRVLPVPAPTPH